MSQLSIAIVGAGGYAGAELITILLRHPRARIAALFGSAKRDAEPPRSIADLHPRLRGRVDLPVLPASADAIAASRPDAVFLATPHEASVELAPSLLESGVIVFDLSAAFRLKDASLYPRYYGFDHARPDLLPRAAYGLPELSRERLSNADLVAVPGCYPTSAIIPLAPLIRAGAIDPERRPIIDSTSGVSGAGRSPNSRTHFCEVSQSPYGVLNHRHQPEIDFYAGAGTLFTPHLGPYDRGILSTIHADLAPGWNGDRVARTLREAYAHEPFVRLLPPGQWPSVAAVRESNFCDLAWAVDEEHRHVILFSALDNLVKGAAGQAVQCMNLRFGLGETTALLEGAR